MPLSVAVLAIAVVVAIVLSPYVAKRLNAWRPAAFLLLAAFGLVIAATLTPTAGALDGTGSDGVCRIWRLGLPPLEALLRVNGVSLNVLLFVPLGVAVGLLPRSRLTVLVLVAAVALPFLVEAIQLVVTPLGRQCQIDDVIANLLGLAIGLVLGAAAHSVLERWLVWRA